MARVLWLTKGLGPGGAERLLVAAADRLPEDIEAQCAYVLPWKDHLAGALERSGVRCTCVGDAGVAVGWIGALARLVHQGRFDVVHGHSPLPMAVARLVIFTVPRSRRPVLMSTEHNAWPTYRWPTRWLNRSTVGLDSRVWAVSEEVAVSTGGRAVALRHGIDVPAVASQRSARSEIRSELGLGDHEMVVGTVANFREQKDYPNLLRAVAAVRDGGSAVRLVIVGQGPLEREVRALAADLGLDDVVFTGFRADATRVMSAFDVFVLASRWEGLPVAVMEATALGLPIVATAVGGVAEHLHDGDDALLVRPGDPAELARALERVLADGSLRRRLGSGAAAMSSTFDAGPAVAAMVSAYREVAPAPPRPPTPTRPAVDPTYDVRPAAVGDREAILRLLSAALGWDAHDERFAAMYAWKHDDNVFGPSPTWVAERDGVVAAVRVFMRWQFVRGGDVLHVVRAVDTATHPDHRGAGLFRALTSRAVDEMGRDGAAFVFNTPNDQSRPGYLSMGWRDVGHLPVAVRVMSPARAVKMVRRRLPASHWSEPVESGMTVDRWLDGHQPAWSPPDDVRALATPVDESFLRWRFGFAPLHYRVIDDGDAAVVVRVRRRGDARELVHAATLRGDADRADRLVVEVGRQTGVDHALRLGAANLRRRFVPAPGGPRLTWRAVNDAGQPPLHNWNLTMGDIELF